MTAARARAGAVVIRRGCGGASGGSGSRQLPAGLFVGATGNDVQWLAEKIGATRGGGRHRTGALPSEARIMPVMRSAGVPGGKKPRYWPSRPIR